jgi:DNA-binding transcriptional ArsR family regulator
MSSSRKTYTESQYEEIAQLFAALAEPVRIRIVHTLMIYGELSVGMLTERCRAKQPTISKHLALLFERNIVERRRVATTVYYSVKDARLATLCSVVCDKLAHEARGRADWSR